MDAQVKVSLINRKSESHNRYCEAWDKMNLLYVGGSEIESKAADFLTMRPKEPREIFDERVKSFYYQNHVGTAINYYLAGLFEKPWTAKLEGDKVMPAKDKAFYDNFVKNSDRAGTSLLEFARRIFKDLVLYGRAAVLVDLPKRNSDLKTLAEEKAAGQFDPHLVSYDPRHVINSGRDKQGELDWVVIHTRLNKLPDAFSALQVVDCWYYFNRTEFAVYERVVPEDEISGKKMPDDAVADLTDSGAHSMAEDKKVPCLFIELPEGLWLMNRAYSPAKNHVNVDCSLDWALKMAALAMPVVQMDGEYEVQLSEAGHIKLPFESKYGWTEPEGKSFSVLAERARELVEQIFRAFYLIAQARSTIATPTSQSGISKQQDMMASKKVLNLFGDVMRDVISKLYEYVSKARRDDNVFEIRGMEFPEDPGTEVIEMVTSVKALNIPSESLDKELDKLVVVAALPEIGPSTRDAIFKEIDSAPSRDERDIKRLEEQSAAAAVPVVGGE